MFQRLKTENNNNRISTDKYLKIRLSAGFEFIILIILSMILVSSCRDKTADSNKNIKPADNDNMQSNLNTNIENFDRREYYRIYAVFDNVSGAEENTPVYLASNTGAPAKIGYAAGFVIIKDKVKAALILKKNAVVCEDAEIIIDYYSDVDCKTKAYIIKNPVDLKNTLPLRPDSTLAGKNNIEAPDPQSASTITRAQSKKIKPKFAL